MRPEVRAVATIMSPNVTQRSLSEIDTRILQLERQLAEDESEAEIDSADLQRVSARKERQAVAAASAKREGTTPAAPAEEIASSSLHCDLCNVGVTSQALMREHLQLSLIHI